MGTIQYCTVSLRTRVHGTLVLRDTDSIIVIVSLKYAVERLQSVLVLILSSLIKLIK